MSSRSNRSALAVVCAASIALAVVALAVAALVLSGSDDTPSGAGASSTSTSTSSVPPVEPSLATAEPAREVPLPVAVRVPEVGISAALMPLGLNPDGTLEVPQDFALAGWYTGRPVPGEPGPSVIAAHVDSRRGPAAFYRLRDVRPGMTIEVERSDSTVARFAVAEVEQHDKDAFPTERVYGPASGSEIRLITCGGRFDRSVGHYTDNVVVFGRLDRIV